MSDGQARAALDACLRVVALPWFNDRTYILSDQRDWPLCPVCRDWIAEERHEPWCPWPHALAALLDPLD